jgi:hypothetical protein
LFWFLKEQRNPWPLINDPLEKQNGDSEWQCPRRSGPSSQDHLFMDLCLQIAIVITMVITPMNATNYIEQNYDKN